MKKYKQLIVGLVIGSMIGMGGSVFAENPSVISVFVKQAINFKFNSEKKELPKDCQVFTYKGNTYVPVKFMAQNLDAEISWDKDTKTFCLDSKKKEEVVKKEVPQAEYHTLPMKKLVGDVWVEITGISVDEDDKTTWIYLEVENKGDKHIQIDQIATKIIVDGKTYEQTDLKNVIYPYDSMWFNDIRKDDEKNGFIKMPIPKKDKWKNITLILNMIQNDGSDKKTEVKFNIALD